MMQTRELLEIFQKYRGDSIVVPGRGGRYWVDISQLPELDAPVGDPAMGGHASFALGLALAQPRRKVVLFDSDGDVLMGMGALATIAEMRPANFYHFMLDNGCYATTGGQPVPNAEHMDYAAMAHAAGYPAAQSIETLDEFSSRIGTILSGPGPVFVRLKVDPEIVNEPISKRRRWQTRSREQVAVDLHAALNG